MNLFKRLAAAVVAVVMVASFAGCHPANETAMSVADVDVSTGMYMCFLIQADSEGRNSVDSATSSDSTSSSTSSTVDYYSQKLEDTDFSEWVLNRAKELATEYATYIKLFNDNGLSLSETDMSTVDQYASYYWDTYGYSAMYEANGVSLATYKNYLAYNYKTRDYFLSVYDTNGTKAVDEATVNSAISDNFAAVDTLTLNLYYTDDDSNTVDYSDEQIAEIKTKAQGYADRLRAGTPFSTIYTEENGSSDTSATTEEAYASVYVSETAQPYCSSNYYQYDNWDTAKALAVGDVQVVEDSTNKQILVMYKYQDILDYSDYIKEFKTSALYILKQAEFESDVKAYSDTLEVKVNDYAIKRFKPSKVEYPTASSTSGTTGTTTASTAY